MHYKLAFEQHETPSSPEATALLNSSAHYLHLRARIEDSGSAEERWWAAVMLGQLSLYDTDKKVRAALWTLPRSCVSFVLSALFSRPRSVWPQSVLSIERFRMSSCPEPQNLRTNSLIR